MAKMHGRLLALLLVITVTATTAAINQNQLATLVNGILRKFDVQNRTKLPMFSLAVSIPYNKNLGKYDLNHVNLDQKVRNAILHCEVYSNRNVVAATVLKWPDVLENCPNAVVPWVDDKKNFKEKPITWLDVNKTNNQAIKNHRADHAEYRVLKAFQHWSKNKDKSGLLLLYVYASPCTDQCTAEGNERSILKLVEGIKQWKEHAVVFSKVFEPKNSKFNSVSVGKRKDALFRLGSHMVQNGLEKIFRCDKVKTYMVCDSCSTEDDVTPRCYENSNHQIGDLNCLPSGGEGQKRRKRSLGKHRGEYDACDVPSRRVPRIKGVMTNENTDYSDDEASSRVLAPSPPTWGMGRERGLSKRQKGGKGGTGREQEGQQENEQGKEQRRKVAKTQGQGKARRGKVAKTQGQSKPQRRTVTKTQGSPRRQAGQPRGWGGASNKSGAKPHEQINTAHTSHRSGASPVPRRQGSAPHRGASKPVRSSHKRGATRGRGRSSRRPGRG
ncbi:uncharacterized protein LOC130919889 isoform X2 [Corythoichthys intestinalis]|uniref:uncharacterized protein LOC130919889 isoform X2 n=1 Tax=Corythoichthys intestinalis TaxID=161448 RepID=UPI0025A55F9D|nr:uncharacterized protein LOC130919889 isoform X2 [Corythoichthys intestinalis]